MADDNKNWLRNLIIGPTPSTKNATLANIIGEAILGGGVIKTLGMEMPSYGKITRDSQLAINAIRAENSKTTEATEKALAADLAGYQQTELGRAEKGLEARGISSPEVAKETAANIKSGLSGAYAAAYAALAKAKLGAQTQLTGALANYHMDLAQKQYQSMLSNYYSKMGIWGALGGLGGAMINSKKPEAELVAKKGPETADSMFSNPKLNLEGE